MLLILLIILIVIYEQKQKNNPDLTNGKSNYPSGGNRNANFQKSNDFTNYYEEFDPEKEDPEVLHMKDPELFHAIYGDEEWF